jgi:mRNA interferase RelE/StbE
MADFNISFARAARKELERLPEAVVDRILARIEMLAKSPRPSGCVKLQGNNQLWRIRVGDYRVVYEIAEPTTTIDISIIRHRRDVYRDL